MKEKRQKISVITLGCAKNTVDSEIVLEALRKSRFELTEIEDADIAVINTCGFIAPAKQESIETILGAVELKRQGKLNKVVVMGCLSERYRETLLGEIPEVDVYVGANKMDQVIRELGIDLKRELLGERLLTTPRHYAYLKISEGCDHPCAFCAIPLMRGKHVSKPMEMVLGEALRLSAAGVKELVVIAQDSTYYGVDLYGKQMLPHLQRELGMIEGIEWIRLMYAYPARFPMELLDVYAENAKLCRYLDIPIQHIGDATLKSMRRGMTSRSTRQLIETIRTRVPQLALRTTLIVGYPTETDEEFEELLAFVREGHFSRLGTFIYSQEDDTAAYALGDPIPEEMKQERQRLIMEAQKEISWRRNQELIGTTVRMIVDRIEGETAVGRTEWDAPEIDNEVVLAPHAGVQVGRLYDVLVEDGEVYDIYATPLQVEEMQ